MRFSDTAILILYATAAAKASAPDFLPLEQGNQWIYRSTSTAETFTISVGTPVMHNGNVYHKVTGYAATPLYVRRADNGNLYWYNENTGADILLTSYEPVARSWYDTYMDGCEQGAQVQRDREQVRVPVGSFNGALVLSYRSYGGCGDRGILAEHYLDNLGLVRRTITTIAGPRTFDLVYARVGALRLSGEPGTSFRISAARSLLGRKSQFDVVTVPVSLRLSVDRSDPVRLRYAASQKFDVQVRNENGDIVYKWSDDVAYPQAPRMSSNSPMSWSTGSTCRCDREPARRSRTAATPSRAG